MPHPVLIAGQWRAASSADSSTKTFFAENPATGERLDAEYPVSAWTDCDAALSAAVDAAAVLRRTPPEQIARFLTRFAERIESIAQQLAETANQETALPVAPRLKDIELPRTTGQ
ncbi:MAG: aldehyde dehydrogenase family protein, partial [Burkholderiales bacterium]|nr:aldehyde dehydrogenase family protein [Phycisphaerae bacterium]